MGLSCHLQRVRAYLQGNKDLCWLLHLQQQCSEHAVFPETPGSCCCLVFSNLSIVVSCSLQGAHLDI